MTTGVDGKNCDRYLSRSEMRRKIIDEETPILARLLKSSTLEVEFVKIDFVRR